MAVIDAIHDIHSMYYFSERSISQLIRIIVTPKIKARLITEADKKFCSGGTGIAPGQ